MKKIYTYFFSLLMLCTVNAGATIWQVMVNDGSFTPANLPNVVYGDTIGWVLNSSVAHTTTSTTIPAGATAWNEPINISSPVYGYIVPNVAGVYNYVCTMHPFGGSFTVSPSGINDPGQAVKSAVYPNPFASSVTLTNHHADAVNIMDLTGQIVFAMPLNSSGSKSEINLDALAPGIYFITTSKEGVIRETKRIVKAK